MEINSESIVLTVTSDKRMIMDKNELESLLMRFSHLEVSHSKNGALLIGKAPHIAEYAWLNIMYPCITEAEVCDLDKKLGCAIPEVYRNFLMNVSNGLNVMNCTLALHGCRTSYNRADFESRYPFNLEDIQKYERPKNATPEMFIFASYNYDCSKLYLKCAEYVFSEYSSLDKLYNRTILSVLDGETEFPDVGPIQIIQ